MPIFQIDLPGIEQPVSPEELSLLSHLKSLILINISDPDFGSKELADGLGLSPVQLSRRLKNITSYPVAKLVRYIRMEFALTLIKDTSWSIKQICDKSGFREPANFCRSFKKHHGRRPTEIRKASKDTKLSFEFYCNSPFKEEDLRFIQWLMKKQSWLNQLIKLVLSKIDDETLDHATLADAMAMSQSQLNRKLKTTLKLTTGGLIKNLRLQLAVELLCYENTSLSCVALRSGFFDHPHFSRCFKSAYGISPRIFRQQAKERQIPSFANQILKETKNDN